MTSGSPKGSLLDTEFNRPEVFRASRICRFVQELTSACESALHPGMMCLVWLSG